MFKCKFNAAGKRVELLLYGAIGEDFFGEGITAKLVADALGEHRNASQIDVRINSEGGNALEGMNIFNLLRRQRAKVHTFVDGAALSAGSLILMAGERIEAAENSMIMIHEAMSGMYGSADELRNRADALDTVSAKIADTYASQASETTAEQFREMMRAETWLSAQQALEIGLVHEVGTPLDIAASFDRNRVRNAPAWAVDRATSRPRDVRAELAELAKQHQGD